MISPQLGSDSKLFCAAHDVRAVCELCFSVSVRSHYTSVLQTFASPPILFQSSLYDWRMQCVYYPNNECGAISSNRTLMWPYLWRVSLVLKGQGADSQRPAPGRPVVREGGGLRVCGAERSHPPALVASGAVWTSVSEPAILSSVAHYVTLTHPEVRKKKCTWEERRHISKRCAKETNK